VLRVYTDTLQQIYARSIQVNEDAVDSDHETPVLPVAPAPVTASRQSTATAAKVAGRDKRGRKMSLERDLIDPFARRKRNVSPIA
jgi:hypothetical protein